MEPLSLSFTREEDWSLVVEQVRTHRGVMFDHRGERFEPFARVPIRFEGPHGPLCEIEGQVVRLTESQVAFTFDEEAVQAVIGARFEKQTVEALWQRYESLGRGEKLKLARHGGPDARRMLLRDRDNSLAPFVLDNPGLEGRELAGLLRVFEPSALFFEKASRDARLMRSPELVEGIVRHPRAPVGLAVRLVSRLPMETLRRLARGGSARMPIVTAARKRVIPR